MRYYGGEYKDFISKSINGVHDSIKDPDYASNVRRVDVSSKNAGLKTECVNAARTAGSHVGSIREKLDYLDTVLSRFYEGVDKTADSVRISAKQIHNLLKDVNDSLVKMNSAINGTGTYNGTKVTPGTIKKAGINEQVLAGSRANIWKGILKTQLDNDALSDESIVAFIDYICSLQNQDLKIPANAKENIDAVFAYFISKMQLLDPEKIPSEDMKRLETIYAYYCNYHLGPSNNIADLKEQTLKNGVDVYELINTKAKKYTYEFFKEAYAKSEDEIDANILRIKYAIYTTDPDKRDIILNCLPHMELNLIEPGERAFCSGSDKPILNLDLREGATFRCCSFFHEFGHGLNYIHGSPAFKYTDDLVLDLKTHMHNALVKMGINLRPELEQDVIDGFFNYDNYNVVNSEGMDWPYPPHWNTGQAAAYYQLRSYYGYQKYTYDALNPKNTNNEAFVSKAVSGYLDGNVDKSDNFKKFKYIILTDVGGGLTNYKIGCNGYSHGIDSKKLPNNASIIRGASKIHKKLTEVTYYYPKEQAGNNYSRKLNDNAADEFFAEYWNYGVLNVDKEPTRSVFPTVCKNYEKTIEEIKNNPLPPPDEE